MERLIYPEEFVLANARVTLNNARQNITALAGFGYDAAALQEFDQAISACEALPREIAQREKVKEQTRNKNQQLSDSFMWCRGFQYRLEVVFGKKSPEYQAFPAQEFKKAEKSETAMLGIFDMIIGLAEKHQAQLAAAGQTPAMIQQGKNLSQQLRDANVAQEVKKDEKYTATQERRQKFLALYDTINKINKIGRLVFKHNPVKRVLFESKWPKRPKDTPPPTAPAA